MLGWEFPPFFAGGAGIVCRELVNSLNQIGVDVTFIMPSGPEVIYDKLSRIEEGKPKLKIIVADNTTLGKGIKIRKIESPLTAYGSYEDYEKSYKRILEKRQGDIKQLYGKNLLEEVQRFAEQVLLIAEEENFDVIHAQDWVTYTAAIALKKKFHKPLVVHVHITEFDKSGGLHADPRIYSVEKAGMDFSDKIITVSNKVKENCINKYFVDPYKVEVIHNAAIPMDDSIKYPKIFPNDKIVLFAGRVTLQKGPDYFIKAARIVADRMPNTKFVMAGTGDMLPRMIEMATGMGLAKNFIFTGFYDRKEAEKLFSMADVYVMPSVSEPFGVIPYEAQKMGTPTIISKQTGISEVLHHTLKVDFWDTNEMANKILALLQYSSLHKEMKDRGYLEAKNSNWVGAASKCLNIYETLIGKGGY